MHPTPASTYQNYLTVLVAILLAVYLQPTGRVFADPPHQASRYTHEPPAGTQIVHPHDGAIMVYVPSGTFTMGMNREQADTIAKALGYRDADQIAAYEWFPARQEWTDGYFIDKYEVTNARWRQFVANAGFKSTLQAAKEPPSKNLMAFALYPVVNILWAEAQQYANWAGKALPTEKQWEKAARGSDARLFPWGNELPTPKLGVFVDLKTDKPTHYQMVGSKPLGASPYGCMDMAGNVYEWTSQWFEPYMNNPESIKMLSYTGHQNAMLRGGSFYHARHAYISAKRFGLHPNETYYHIGFRTVWVPPSGYFTSPAFQSDKAKITTQEKKIQVMRQEGSPTPPNSF